MKLFIDTADVAQIREAWSWGIIDGVTTNPSHVARSGRNPREVYREICDIVNGPISLETIALDAEGIVKEAVELAKIHQNVVIKVPIMKEGLKAVKILASEGYKTNVTVTFSPLQALLAAKAGATYVSPFVGRLDAVGHDGMEVVRQIKTIYDNYGFTTQIITAAARNPLHVLQAALAGSHVMTMSFDILQISS
jgi:transaldolase